MQHILSSRVDKLHTKETSLKKEKHHNDAPEYVNKWILQNLWQHATKSFKKVPLIHFGFHKETGRPVNTWKWTC